MFMSLFFEAPVCSGVQVGLRTLGGMGSDPTDLAGRVSQRAVPRRDLRHTSPLSPATDAGGWADGLRCAASLCPVPLCPLLRAKGGGAVIFSRQAFLSQRGPLAAVCAPPVACPFGPQAWDSGHPSGRNRGDVTGATSLLSPGPSRVIPVRGGDGGARGV